MFSKLKSWIIGNVIIKKVLSKVAKHATTALAAFLSGPWAAKVIVPIMNQLGISIDFDTFEAGLIVLLTGLGGGLWNYIDHRFLKNSSSEQAPA